MKKCGYHQLVLFNYLWWHFWMGGKFHAKSPKLCFWWIGSYFLQTLLKGSKKQTSLHGALHVIKQKVDEKVEV